MSNELIVTMCAAGDISARRERLTRHIMAADGCEWDEANETVDQICQVRPCMHGKLVCNPGEEEGGVVYSVGCWLRSPITAAPCWQKQPPLALFGSWRAAVDRKVEHFAASQCGVDLQHG